jgi:hypothetical protein
MKTIQQNLRTLLIGAVLLLAGMSQRTTGAIDPKTASRQKEQGVSLRDLMAQTKQVVVFQKQDTERKYIGNLAPNSSALQKFRAALTEGIMAKETDLSRTDYELVLVEGSSYRLAKYDAGKRVMAVYAVQQKELNALTTIKLKAPLRDVLASAKPLSPLPEKPQPSDAVRGSSIGEAPTVEKAVDDSVLIIVGTPVATLEDRYDREAPGHYTVYLVGVERVLKNTTGRDLPIVPLNHINFPELLKPQFGKLYLFFLKGGKSSLVIYGRDGKPSKTVNISEPGEYTHVVGTGSLIENRKALPLMKVLDHKWIEWLNGPEQEVIARVKAEIEWQRKAGSFRIR